MSKRYVVRVKFAFALKTPGGISICGWRYRTPLGASVLRPDYHLADIELLIAYVARLGLWETPLLILHWFTALENTRSSKPAAKTMYDNASRTRASVAILLHSIYGIRLIVVTV